MLTSSWLASSTFAETQNPEEENKQKDESDFVDLEEDDDENSNESLDLIS